MNEKPEFCRPVSLGDVTRKPKTTDLEATPDERRNLAERFGIDSIETLKGRVTFRLSRACTAQDTDIVEISAQLTARVGQKCVVTLEPVHTTIETTFEGIITSEAALLETAAGSDETDDLDSPEILGAIADNSMDFGEILAEQLSLELDPFPRKEGVVFDENTSDTADGGTASKPNPFAVLAKLKDNRV